MLRGSVGCPEPGHGEEVFLAGDRIKGPARDQLADELAAFANSSGGVVVLGVSDEPRAVTGIPLEHLDALERYVSEIANDSITPPVVPLIEKLELPDADGRMRPVLKVEIPRGFFVHQSPGGYLHRVGSSKRQMEPAVLARLFEQRSQSRVGQFDRQVVAEASLDDLDARLVDRFRGEISGDDRTTALSKLDVIREDRCPVPDEIETPRVTMMDRRGEGVPAILARSRRLSGKQPRYEMFGDELRLTIYAADPEAGRDR